MGWDPFGAKASKDIKKASRQAAAAAREAAEAQAESFRFNAGVYARNADTVEEQSLMDEAKQRRAGARFMGEQDAAIAGSGFQDSGFGDIRENTGDELDLDAIIIRRQGQAKAADYLAQEELAYMNADNAIRAGEATAQATILEGSIRASSAQNSAISGSIGMALQAGSIAFSDARVKERIERVGTTPNGLGVFAFNYVWEDRDVRRVGVMAQEARERFPDAISASADGILCVDYRKIGLPQGYSFADALKPARARQSYRSVL